MEEAPGRVSPRVSVMDVIVEAVPIVMQWPGPGVIWSSKSSQSSQERLPAPRSAQYFQTSDPEARGSPRQELASCTAGHEYDGDINHHGTHQKSGNGLVAASHKDGSIHRMGTQGFFNFHCEHIAIEHGGGLHEGLT